MYNLYTVHHKKQFLQRWLDTVVDHTPPMSHDSPLFSDWSDGEDFDDLRGKLRNSKTRNKDSSSFSELDDSTEQIDQPDSPHQSHDSICSDISEVSMAQGPKTPPIREELASPINSPAPVNISDISSDSNIIEMENSSLLEEDTDIDHVTDHMTAPLSPKTPIKRKVSLYIYIM